MLWCSSFSGNVSMNSVTLCLFVVLLLYKMLAFNQYCFILLFHSVQIKTGSVRAVRSLFNVIDEEKRNEKEREGEKKGKREREKVNEKKREREIEKGRRKGKENRVERSETDSQTQTVRDRQSDTDSSKHKNLLDYHTSHLFL